MQKALLIFLGLLALGYAATTPFTPEESTQTDLPTKTTTVELPTETTTAASLESSTVYPADTTPAVDTTTNVPEPCLSKTQAWGVPNPFQFKFCDNGTPLETPCLPNQYYVSNDKISGCVPVSEVDPNCLNQDVEVEPCTGNNVKQPQYSETLTGYWYCPVGSQSPKPMTCPEGQAFCKQDGWMGCFEWPEWRQLRGCQTY